MSLRIGLVLAALLASNLATAAEPPSAPSDVIDEARSVIKTGKATQGADLLQPLLEQDLTPDLLDKLSRLFEDIGWIRDARIASDRLANSPHADPTLRALHAQRSKHLQTKEAKAYLKVPITSRCSNVFIDQARVDPPTKTTEVSPGSTTVECLSKDGHDLRFFRVTTHLGRRIDLNSDAPLMKLVTSIPPWKSLTLGSLVAQSDLSKVKRIHLSPGKHSLFIRIDEQAPLQLEVKGEAGERINLEADVIAARRLRDLRKDKEMSVRNQAGPYITTAVAALTAGAGWALLAVGGTERRQSKAASLSPEQRNSLVQSANKKETSGGILLGVGIAAGVTGLVWYLVNLARGKKAARRVSLDKELKE